MTKNSDDLNIEWKNSSIGNKEKPSRRINEHSALKYKAYKKNSFFSHSLVTPADFSNFTKDKKKKSIITSTDEDEDDDEYKNYQNSSTLNTLPSDDFELEKQNLLQKNELEQMERQHKAEQLGALQTAEQLAGSVGFHKLSDDTSAMIMNNVSSSDIILSQSINYDIKKRLKIRGNKIKPFAVNDFFLGIKRIEALVGKSALKGMKAKEIIILGRTKKRDSQICKIILKKTGRKISQKKTFDKKRLTKAQKEFNQIISKNTLLHALEKNELAKSSH